MLEASEMSPAPAEAEGVFDNWKTAVITNKLDTCRSSRYHVAVTIQYFKEVTTDL